MSPFHEHAIIGVLGDAQVYHATSSSQPLPLDELVHCQIIGKRRTSPSSRYRAEDPIARIYASELPSKRRRRKGSGGFPRDSASAHSAGNPEPTSSALQRTPTSRSVAHSPLMLSTTPGSDLPYKVFPPTQTPFWLLNSFIANRLSSFLTPFAAVRPRHGRRAVATRAFGISNVRSLNVSTLQRLLPKALFRRYQHYNRHVSDFRGITATTQRIGGTPDSPSPKPHLTVKIIPLTSYFYIFIRKTNPVFAILAASAITPPTRITEAENIWPPK